MAGVNTLSSKISTKETPPRVRTLAGVSTSNMGAVGITERGPFDPTLVTSFAEFTNVYGGDTLNSDLVHAVRGFFENGGQRAYIQRVVHCTDIDVLASRTSAASTANVGTAAGAAFAGTLNGTINAPFVLSPGDDLQIDVDGGATATATFDAAAATRTSGNTEPFALTNGNTLLISIDGGADQTIIFNTAAFAAIGAATAVEVAAVINSQLAGGNADVAGGTVVVASDTEGTASSVEITGGTDAAAFAFPAGAATGTGDVADIAAVSFAEAKALIEADVAGLTVTDGGSGKLVIASNTTGASSSIQVLAVSAADDKMGLNNATQTGGTGASVTTFVVNGKTDGTYADAISVIIQDATNGETDCFDLLVQAGGLVVESFANLKMLTTDPNYASNVVNSATVGSNLIALVDSATGIRPGNGTYGPLTGGDDGLTGLADTDFLGSALTKTGIRGFDRLSDLNILTVPGRATPAVHQGMVVYCEQTKCRSCIAILDPPENQTTAQIINYTENTAGLLNFSEHGAMYYPWVSVLNPDTTLFGDNATIDVPPSGHIAGVYARTDAARIGGVYDAPAGVERGRLFGVFGYQNADTEEEGKRDLLYPKRINPLSIVNGLRVIDGVRTLKGNGNFPSVSERRGVTFIEQTIKNGLEFARFRNNDDELRAEVNRTVRLFLINQMRVKAFRSQVPDEAFSLNFGTDINTPSVICEGQLLGEIGLATQKPAEFIILCFSQDTRAKEAEALAG